MTLAIRKKKNLPNPCESTKQRHDPLKCWLWNIQINIPDQSFHEGIFSASIKSMICTNFAISSIDSSYTSTSNQATPPKDPSINLTISSITATCAGQFHSGLSGGTITATMSQSSDSLLDISFTSTPGDEYDMATGAHVTKCSFPLEVKHGDLIFSGSFSASFLELFANTIADSITSTLRQDVCPNLIPKVKEVFTENLVEANAVMLGWIAEEAGGHEESPDDLDGDLYVEWEDVKALKNGLHLGNEVLQMILKNYGGASNNWGTSLLSSTRNLLLGQEDGGSCFPVIPDSASFNFSSLFYNLTINFSGYGNMTLRPDTFDISGLDSLEQTSTFLEPTGNESLYSRIVSHSGFNVSSGWYLQVDPSGGDIDADSLVERFDFDLKVSNVDISTLFQLGVGKENFSEETAGGILSKLSEGNWQCLFRSLDAVNWADAKTHLKIHALQFAPRDASRQSLEGDLDRLMENFVNMFLQSYDAFITDAVDGFFFGPLRSDLNQFLSTVLKRGHDDGTCPLPPPPQENGSNFIRLDELVPLKRIRDILNSTSGIIQLNRLVNCTTNDFDEMSSGVLFAVDIGPMNITARDLSVTNLGSIFELDIFEPEIDSYHLKNSIGLGTQKSTYLAPITSSITLDLNDNIFNYDGTVELIASFSNIAAMGGIFLQYDLNKLSSLTLSQLLNSAYCGMEPLSTFQLYDIMTSVDTIQLDVNMDIRGMPNGTQNRTFYFTGQELSKDLYQLSSSWENIFNRASATNLEEMSNSCLNVTPSPSPYNKIHHSWRPLFTVTVIASIIFLVASFSFVWKRRLSIARKADETISEEEAAYSVLSDKDETDDHSSETPSSLPKASNSLMLHGATPGILRHTIPIIILSTMFLFITSNISTGASVDIRLTSLEHSLTLPPLFEFSLGSTLREMYHAGVYSLMVLIGVFSGFWPYLKLSLMLLAWVIPQYILSTNKRENLLIWLDALGKFSLVDTYVLVMMMVAFRFHLDIGGGEENTKSLGVDAYVNPRYGFYSFLAATIISLVKGHLILYYHRKTTIRREYSRHGPKESLRQHQYLWEGARDHHKCRLTDAFQIVLGIMLLATLILLSVGMTEKSFLFEFKGLTGHLLGDNSTASYSLISLGLAIPLSVEVPNAGVHWIEVTYFFFGAVMPYACLLLLTILFVYPMRIQTQRIFFTMAEIAYAWSALEVFVLSVVAALLQISQFAAYIVGDKCDTINKILVLFFYEKLDGDCTCYDVTAEVGSRSWILFTGVFFNLIVTRILLKLAHWAVDERMDREGTLLVDCDHDDELEEGGSGENVRKWWSHGHGCFCRLIFVEALDSRCDDLVRPLLGELE